MKRKLLLILICTLFISNVALAILEGGINSIEPPSIRDSQYFISIPKGVFLKAILQENISTATNLKYDTITAIIPTNFYAVNSICIPKSSIIEGEISQLELPKKGRHGLLKVKFNKIITPEGKIFKTRASLWTNGSSQVGGGPSQLGEVKVIPHRVQDLNQFGYLSIKRTGEYLKGKDVSIKAGSEILVKLDEKLNIKL